MAALLMKEAFDAFLLREASLTTFCTYSVDGTWQPAYFGNETRSEADGPDDSASSGSAPAGPRFTPWSYLRSHLFELIKGQHTPLSLKIVFQYPPDLTAALLAEEGLASLLPSLYGLYLNIRYESGKIFVTTGSAQQNFPPDHSVDVVWDAAVKSFLGKNGLAFEDIT